MRVINSTAPAGNGSRLVNCRPTTPATDVSARTVAPAGVPGPGCASVIVMDETTDIVKQVYRMAYFYAHESCGQCTPCREGTAWVTKILKRILDGRGTEEDLDTLVEVTNQMTGTTICVLSDSVAAPVQSSIRKFRDDYLALIRRGERVGAA